MRASFACACVLVCTSARVSAATIAYNSFNQGPFYVSPSGSDSTGDGSIGNPWRQPQHAADYVRTHLINQVMNQDIVINLKAGSYAPLALANYGPQLDDGGHNGHLIKYVSVDGVGAAVIDAGVAVTGWTLVSGSTYKASVPNTFTTVYENGVRSTEARYPNLSMTSGFTSTREPYLISQTDSATIARLKYNPADFTGGFDPSTVSVSDLRVVEWSGGFWEWKTDRQLVSSVDPVNHLINFTNSSKFQVYNTGGSPVLGSRYFIEGTRDMLDAPGEWYLDKGAMQLYYIARDGPIASQSIVIPTAAEAITVTGLSQKFRDHVSNVVFDGIAVRHTDFVDYHIGGWPVPSAGTVNYPVPTPWIYPFFAWLAQQPQFHLGAVHLKNTDHVTLQNMLIEDAGMYGVFCDGWCSNNTIQHDWIRRVGASAIRLEGQFPGLGDWVNNNTITDDRLNNVGELSGEGGGVDIAQSGSNTVSYSYIFNGPRKGIWILAVTGQASFPGTVYTVGNVVDHVKMQFLEQDSGDTGVLGFDSLSSVAPALKVNSANQVIIDTAVANPSVRDTTPCGVYNDDETTGTQLSDVETTNIAGCLMFPHSTPATPVNCSFLIDGTANGSFNPALIDTVNIGTTSSFPWPCTAFDATGKCTAGGVDPG